MKTLQDLMSKVFDNDSSNNETVEVLEFVRDNAVPITNEQAEALFLLQLNGMSDLAEFVIGIRKHMTPYASYTKMVEMMTLAHRIKGSAKLDNVLKQDANPGVNLNTDKAAKGR